MVGDGRYVFASTLRAGEAQWYSSTFHDRHGSFFDGGHSYRFKLHAGQSQKLSWSMTLYDNRNRRTMDIDQQLGEAVRPLALARQRGWLGRSLVRAHAAAGDDGQLDQDDSGAGFFAMFRLFAPLETVLDGNWKLNDVERVG